MSAPLIVEVSTGANVSTTVQLAPTASVAPQVPVRVTGAGNVPNASGAAISPLLTST